MLKKIISQISDIFVGRTNELEILEDIWSLALQDKEHLVYIFLNAPGIGKTTLIHYFGNFLEKEGRGLFIKFACSTDYDSSADFNKDFLFRVQNIIHDKQEFINNYINSVENVNKKQAFYDKVNMINSEISKILTQDLISLSNITFILKRLSEIIPVFFAADEIQEFQKKTFNGVINNFNEEETALHYFTRILKSLLTSRILLVLSGTRYHILSQIGTKIGSPIRHKVKLLVIQQFNPEEINEYIEQVKRLIAKFNENI